MTDVLAVVLGAIVTFATRVIFLLNKRLRPPKSADRYLKLVGPAVLAAIALPGFVVVSGTFPLLETLAALLAGGAAYVVWRWTRQIVFGLLGGLVVWWGLLALVSLA